MFEVFLLQKTCSKNMHRKYFLYELCPYFFSADKNTRLSCYFNANEIQRQTIVKHCTK